MLQQQLQLKKFYSICQRRRFITFNIDFLTLLVFRQFGVNSIKLFSLSLCQDQKAKSVTIFQANISFEIKLRIYITLTVHCNPLNVLVSCLTHKYQDSLLKRFLWHKSEKKYFFVTFNVFIVCLKFVSKLRRVCLTVIVYCNPLNA